MGEQSTVGFNSTRRRDHKQRWDFGFQSLKSFHISDEPHTAQSKVSQNMSTLSVQTLLLTTIIIAISTNPNWLPSTQSHLQNLTFHTSHYSLQSLNHFFYSARLGSYFHSPQPILLRCNPI